MDGSITTNKGVALIGKLLAQKGALQITRVAVGDGTPPASPATLNALVHELKNATIESVDNPKFLSTPSARRATDVPVIFHRIGRERVAERCELRLRKENRGYDESLRDVPVIGRNPGYGIEDKADNACDFLL